MTRSRFKKAMLVFWLIMLGFMAVLYLYKSNNHYRKPKRVVTALSYNNFTYNASLAGLNPSAAQINQAQEIYQDHDLDQLNKLSPRLMGQILLLNRRWQKLPHHPWVLVITKSHADTGLFQDDLLPYLNYNPFGKTNRYGLILGMGYDAVADKNSIATQVNDDGLGIDGLRYYRESDADNLLMNNQNLLKSDNAVAFNNGVNVVLTNYNNVITNHRQYPKPSVFTSAYNVYGPRFLVLGLSLILSLIELVILILEYFQHRGNVTSLIDFNDDDDIVFLKSKKLGNDPAAINIESNLTNTTGFEQDFDDNSKQDHNK